MTKTAQDIALEIIQEYAPYHRMPQFKRGAADYKAGRVATNLHGVEGQAYARGAEAQMRIDQAFGK